MAVTAGATAALRLISGPMPAGSPMAMAMRGSRAISAPPWLRPRSTAWRQVPWPPRGSRRKFRHRISRTRNILHRERRIEKCVGEPRLELGAAAVAAGVRRLRLTGRAVRRAADADVEVIVVPPPRPHLLEPGAVRARLAAQRHLDRRVDEDALHLGVRGGRLDHVEMARRPQFRIDVAPAVGDDHGRGHLLALGAGKLPRRHRGEPDVGIEADLVARMAPHHRAAARLRHVADEETGQVPVSRPGAEPFQETDEVRMPPVAVAGEPHHLPGRAVDRQCRRAGNAAVGIKADCMGRPRARQHLAAEHLLRRRLGIVGMGERRQRLRVERARILGDGPRYRQEVAKRGATRAVSARLVKAVRIESTTRRRRVWGETTKSSRQNFAAGDVPSGPGGRPMR